MASNPIQPVMLDDRVFAPLELQMIAERADLPAEQFRACLAQASLTPECLESPAQRISCRQRISAFTACCLAHSDPWFALRLGQKLHLTTYGMAGLALLSSPTLAKALDTANEFSALMNLDQRLMLELYPQTAELRLVGGVRLLGAQKRFFTLLEMGKVIRLLDDILDSEFRIERIELDLSGDSDDEREISHLAGIPVHLNRPDNLVCFPVSHARRPLPQSHGITHQACWAASNEQLQEVRRHHDIGYQVQRILLAAPGCIPALTEVAAALHVSARTLRRRLEAEHSTYNQILEDVRTQLAVRYLLDSTLTTEAISERLSYSDAANFRHAFKRWTGCTPKAFRAEHRVGESGMQPASLGTHAFSGASHRQPGLQHQTLQRPGLGW